MSWIRCLKRWLKYDAKVYDLTTSGSLTGYLLENYRGNTKPVPLKLSRKLNSARKHLERQRKEVKGNIILFRPSQRKIGQNE